MNIGRKHGAQTSPTPSKNNKQPHVATKQTKQTKKQTSKNKQTNT